MARKRPWDGSGGSDSEKTVEVLHPERHSLPLALAIIAAEFLGPIALVAGFFTRWSAFGIGLVMTGAALMVHASNGFFMNWMGTQKGEGIEYFILAVSLSLAFDLSREAEAGRRIVPSPASFPGIGE